MAVAWSGIVEDLDDVVAGNGIDQDLDHAAIECSSDGRSVQEVVRTAVSVHPIVGRRTVAPEVDPEHGVVENAVVQDCCLGRWIRNAHTTLVARDGVLDDYGIG